MTYWMLLSCLYLFCAEDVEVMERFIFLGSDILVSAGQRSIDNVSQTSIDV